MNNAEQAALYIERYGMHIIPIEPGRKFPVSDDWGNNAIATTTAAREFYEAKPDWNMGMVLYQSGFCSLDIDCEESFRSVLDEFGIDISELSQYPTIQGNPKGRRITFRVPEDAQLKYQSLNWPKEEDPTKRYTVFELRMSDGKQRQDVLPPSIHPDTGKPYRWLVRPPENLEDWPTPPEWLVSIWEAWDKFKGQLKDACPWVIPEIHSKQEKKKRSDGQDNSGSRVIDEYIANHDLKEELVRYGYRRIGKRFLSPHSGTGLPGVTVFPDGWSAWCHHASDPLCSEASGQPVNSFDLYCEYEFGGDVSKAVRAYANAEGIMRPRQPSKAAQSILDAGMPPPMPLDDVPDDYIDQQPPETIDVYSTDVEEPKAPFRALGYDGDQYFYLPRGTEQVVSIRRGSHTSPAEMMAMAPLEWWEMAFPKEKGGTDWHAAASHCFRACERRGVYSARNSRGRGSWYDDKRSVLHLGDRLIVDGVEKSISDHKSRYIYARSEPMESPISAKPATIEQARAVLDIFEWLNWEKPINAHLLAGWTVLAPICGALKWRPHCWITSQRGGGKSFTQNSILRPLISDPVAMIVQGASTEAGIRQQLRNDARPILFDEAESENQGGQKRMQSVVELARQSSSDSSAEIIKGTATGGGMSFRMRSMFMLGSVNVALSQAADESRFTVLSLNPPDKSPGAVSRFREFEYHVADTLTDDYCASIRARTYSMLPVIRANAKTLAHAVAEELGSQRLGDQVGTLLAGNLSLLRDDEISLDDARAYVKGIDLADARQAEEVSDEESCINLMMQYQIKFESDKGLITRSIGEVVLGAAGRQAIGLMTKAEMNAVLMRHGLRVENDKLAVANKHSELSKIMRDSAWAAGWTRVLARMKGGHTLANPVRFGGTRSRAVEIPIDSFM